MNIKNLFVTRLKEDFKPEKNVVSFVASTDSEDRYFDVINQFGWNLDSYKKNNIVLLNHNSLGLPIGKGDVEVIDGKLVIEVEFDMKDELATTIARKCKDGFINAVSVGFNSKDAIKRNELPKDSPYYGERGMYFRSAELLEVSIVTIPANSEAVAAKNYQLISPESQQNIAENIAKYVESILNKRINVIKQTNITEVQSLESDDNQKEKQLNHAILAELLNYKEV